MRSSGRSWAWRKMGVDVFQDARRLVSTRSAAEYYGFTANRAGYICCPFHNERTPSLKLFPDGGWKCFGCGRGGSSIDFVMELFGLPLLEAVRKMNMDFNLALPLDKPPSEAQQEAAWHRREIMDIRKMFDSWREKMLLQLTTAYRMGYLALKDKHPDTWTDAEVLAVKWMSALEYWADALDGSSTEQMAVFRDRKEVGQLCGRILQKENFRKSATA